MVLRICGIIFSFILLCPVLSFADDYIPPQFINLSTPSYHPDLSHFRPPLGTYEYKVTWQGIPAATLTLSVEEEGLRYRVVASAKTYKAIDLFYRLRYRGEALVSAIDLLPLETRIHSAENSRVKEARISFLPNGDIDSEWEYVGKEKKEFHFNSGNFTLDPFSAAFIARSLTWQKGETKELDAFNGKSRYLVSLTAVDKVKMKVNSNPVDVWVISPKVKNLTSPGSNKKLREAKIYITADESRQLLKIKSEVFIGSVNTTLVSYTPSQRPQSGTSLAAAAAAKTEGIYLE